MSPDRKHYSQLEHLGKIYDITVREKPYGFRSDVFKSLLAGLTIVAELRDSTGVRLFDVGLEACLNALEEAGRIDALQYSEDHRQECTITFDETEVTAEIR